ncbi:hypothetical protein [Streptococcus pyogenes]|uniref:hypothetical protein n=1 Tax=Streptococcus pyogenes TaxID=1314 RepID=UPI00223E0E26|nr:hypothetical protein [Streptococcus pyogenes]
MLRHLRMNSQLRQICGFETHGVRLNSGVTKLVSVPSKSAYSRFMQDLQEVCPDIEDWIQAGVEELYDLLPDFGRVLALDGKIIETYCDTLRQKEERG